MYIDRAYIILLLQVQIDCSNHGELVFTQEGSHLIQEVQCSVKTAKLISKKNVK